MSSWLYHCNHATKEVLTKISIMTCYYWYKCMNIIELLDDYDLQDFDDCY